MKQDAENSIPVLLDFEKKKLGKLHEKITTLHNRSLKKPLNTKDRQRFYDLSKEMNEKLAEIYSNLDNWKKTQVARHPERPYTLDYIKYIFDDFIELHGDRGVGDDCAIIGGFASLDDGQTVMVVGHQKGRNTDENIKRNFGMAQPEGYRKALRLFRLAEKFGKPIVTFVDTPGAYPGITAEKRGQGEAIAKNIKEMFSLTVPSISFIIGEGGSGGALALAVTNVVYMLEHSIYSVISPESCASILWRDAAFREEAANALKNDAQTAKSLKIIEDFIKEPMGGAHRDHQQMAQSVKKVLKKELAKYNSFSKKKIVKKRIERFREIGVFGK